MALSDAERQRRFRERLRADARLGRERMAAAAALIATIRDVPVHAGADHRDDLDGGFVEMIKDHFIAGAVKLLNDGDKSRSEVYAINEATSRVLAELATYRPTALDLLNIAEEAGTGWALKRWESELQKIDAEVKALAPAAAETRPVPTGNKRGSPALRVPLGR